MGKARALTFGILVLFLFVGRGASSTLADVRVTPNPVRVFSGQTEAVFERLPVPAHIVLYTADGVLVRGVLATDPSGVYRWDLKDEAGRDAAPGVYLYVISDESGRQVRGKLSVIR